MAKFDGIFNIEGTLKGITFYKSKDGHISHKRGREQRTHRQRPRL